MAVGPPWSKTHNFDEGLIVHPSRSDLVLRPGSVPLIGSQSPFIWPTRVDFPALVTGSDHPVSLAGHKTDLCHGVLLATAHIGIYIPIAALPIKRPGDGIYQ